MLLSRLLCATEVGMEMDEDWSTRSILPSCSGRDVVWIGSHVKEYTAIDRKFTDTLNSLALVGV